jgi:hypothetical protein
MSKMIRLFLTLCLLATLATLASGDGTAKTKGRAHKKIMLDKNFVLSVGQEVSTPDGKLKIKFVSVPEDSRCPTGVDCIWAGNARVVLQVSQTRGKLVTLELNTNPRDAADAAEGNYGHYRIKLVGVAPYPVAEQTIAPRSYTTTLVVSKKS